MKEGFTNIFVVRIITLSPAFIIQYFNIPFTLFVTKMELNSTPDIKCGLGFL